MPDRLLLCFFICLNGILILIKAFFFDFKKRLNSATQWPFYKKGPKLNQDPPFPIILPIRYTLLNFFEHDSPCSIGWRKRHSRMFLLRHSWDMRDCCVINKLMWRYWTAFKKSFILNCYILLRWLLIFSSLLTTYFVKSITNIPLIYHHTIPPDIMRRARPKQCHDRMCECSYWRINTQGRFCRLCDSNWRPPVRTPGLFDTWWYSILIANFHLALLQWFPSTHKMVGILYGGNSSYRFMHTLCRLNCKNGERSTGHHHKSTNTRTGYWH